MPPKKRKTQEAESAQLPPQQSRFVAGKHPRSDEKLPVVDYHTPLDAESELFSDDDWSIPKFNLFITFTLDNLVESFRSIFKDFIKLPSRKFHPGYFYKIDQPISINEIKSRDYEYVNGQRNFLLDVELITKNCYSYNDPESLIVKNSMQAVNYIKYEVLKAKNVTRNYLINNEVKNFLIKSLDLLINATDKSIAEVLENSTEGLDDTMHLSEPFMELVNKDELPEYYEVVHRPIALKLVKNNLEMGYYTKIYDFYIDIELVFQNALVFNGKDTLIYQDSEKLLRFFRKMMHNKFFVELKDASERGEVKLEYDKVEYEQYLANGGDNEEAGLEDEEGDMEDYDFNHYEGLGNGYNRPLFSGDYLLGPSRNKMEESKARKVLLETDEDQPEVLKYNILKSLGNDSFKHSTKRNPYTLIHEISVSSSRSIYKQATKPLQGTLPPINQSWVEYIFKGEDLRDDENMFSITMPPVQSSITLLAHLNCPPEMDFQTSLTVNREKANPSPSMTTDQRLVPSRYEVRLSEGLNFLEYSCQDHAANKTEVLKLWIEVVP